jgi:Domain of unknown function (DUF4263)
VDAFGRRFVEPVHYQLVSRFPLGLASNRAWLYTIDLVRNPRFNREVARLLKWRAAYDRRRKIWKKYGPGFNLSSQAVWQVIRSGGDRFFQTHAIARGAAITSLLGAGPAPAEVSGTRAGSGAGRTVEEEVESAPALPEVATRSVVDRMHRQEHFAVAERLRRMRSRIRVYRQDLEEFRRLIRAPRTTETRIHEFIRARRPFWLFGLEYVEVDSDVPFPPARPVFEFDLMLKRADLFYDLVELKGPNAKLFTKTARRRWKPSVDLSAAIGQVLAYLKVCGEAVLPHLFRPKAIIVVGKETTDNAEQRRLLGSHMTQVDIETYTSLLERGEILLDHLGSVGHRRGSRRTAVRARRITQRGSGASRAPWPGPRAGDRGQRARRRR